MKNNSLTLNFRCAKNEDRFFAPRLSVSRNQSAFLDPGRRESTNQAVERDLFLIKYPFRLFWVVKAENRVVQCLNQVKPRRQIG